MATQGQARMDSVSTTSSSPTCPWTLRTTPIIHQRKTRRNTPVTQHAATEPAQHGEGLRQTQIYMRRDKAEPGDSLRAEPVPARTATKPRRSPRIKAGPQAPLTARDKQTKTRTINEKVIDRKRNSAKHASRKLIASLIRTRLKIDEVVQQPTKMNNTTTDKRRDTTRDPIFTYHVPCSKGTPSPAPITQGNPETQPTAAATAKNATWEVDGRVYGKTDINHLVQGTRKIVPRFW